MSQAPFLPGFANRLGLKKQRFVRWSANLRLFESAQLTEHFELWNK